MISVLYVDDEPGLLDVAQFFLEEDNGIRVRTSRSAKEALTFPEILTYDAIISDYRMPGMDGIGFLKAIRKLSPDIPFILFTGKGREEVVIEAINNGADSYLQKGGDPEAQFVELAHRIRQVVARRQAERLRTETEKRLLDIINFLPDATFAIDRSGTVIAWNHSMEEMTGLSPEVMLGKGNYEYSIPFYGMRRPILIDKILTPQADLSNDYSYIRADREILTAETLGATPRGKQCVLWGRAAPLINSGGDVIGAIESIRDITEAKTAEDRLKRSEERYRELSDLLPQMVYEIDPGFTVTYVNRHAMETFSVTGEEIRGGLNALEFVDPAQHERFKQEIYKTENNTSQEPREYTARKRDGSTFPILVYSSPIYRNSVIMGFRGVVIDISARKKMEDGLRESEKKFRSIFEISPYPMAINSLPDNRFLDVNRAFLEVSGYKPGDVLGKDPVSMGLLALPEALKLISRRVSDGKIENVPLALTAKEGNRIHVLFSTVPITVNNVPATVTVATEVTKLKRVEEDLLQINAELKKAYEKLSVTDNELRQNYEELSKKERVLRESEEKFRALVELSLDGILIADFSGSILFVNQTACRIVDVPEPSRVIGRRNVMEFIAPESREDVAKDFSNVSKGTDTYLASYKVVSETKRELWVESIGKKIPFGNREAVLVSMRDVTERWKAEEQLRESENRFSTVFRSSPIALTLVSATDGTFIDVNDSFLRNTGYSRHEIIGSMAAAVGLFADRGEYKRFSTALRNQRAVQGMEMKCRIKSGEVRLCRFSSGVINMNGRPYILSSVEDITDRRRTENELLESEMRLRRLADNAPDLIFRMSLPDRKYEYVSPASVEMTGYEPEEFYADPDLILRLIHPDWHEYFRRQWEALMKNEAPPFYEFQIIDRAGNVRWLNQRNILVTDDNGTPVAIEGIVTDITHRKNTEHELRRNELRYLALTENAGAWIWEVDPEGLYRYSSPAVMKILGYRPEELVGKIHFYDLFDPEVREELKTGALKAFASHEPFRDFLNKNIHKNGTPVTLSTSATPVFDEDGRFSGYCGIDEDITDRTVAAAALQAMVRSMVGTTGHESLDKITESISVWLKADCVMVGTVGPDGETVRVLSMLLDGKKVDSYSYSLKGTPCEQAKEKGYCIYPDDAQHLFPGSRDIVELKIRGYIGTPLRDSRGNVIGILCVLFRGPVQESPQVREIMDIIAVKAAAEIERIRIETELFENRQMLVRAMDLTNLANWEYDPAIGLFRFNDRFYTLYGTSAAEEGGYLMAPEKYVREFVHPDDRDTVAAVLNQSPAASDPAAEFQMEHRIIRRDGEVCHIAVRVGVTVDARGNVTRIHGANQDITERKKAGEALQQAHRKLHLLSSITRHDINNQLLALNGFVSILHRKISDPSLSDLFQRITRANTQITTMIQFTREYEKIGVQAPAWQSLASVIDSAGKGIIPDQIVLRNDLTEEIEVYADPLIVKVFYNLLDNSIRHGQRVTDIRVSSTITNDDLVVIWEDNGIGIPEEEKEMIFERGFGKNTGLGMFLVREILSLTGMTIRETGTPALGARFEISMPKGSWRLKRGDT